MLSYVLLFICTYYRVLSPPTTTNSSSGHFCSNWYIFTTYGCCCSTRHLLCRHFSPQKVPKKCTQKQENMKTPWESSEGGLQGYWCTVCTDPVCKKKEAIPQLLTLLSARLFLPHHQGQQAAVSNIAPIMNLPVVPLNRVRSPSIHTGRQQSL